MHKIKTSHEIEPKNQKTKKRENWKTFTKSKATKTKKMLHKNKINGKIVEKIDVIFVAIFKKVFFIFLLNFFRQWCVILLFS